MQAVASKKKAGKSNRRKSFKAIKTVHNQEPDYVRPPLKLPSETRKRMSLRLRFLYGEAGAKAYMPELERILKVYYAHRPQKMIEQEKDFNPTERFTQEDVILSPTVISYVAKSIPPSPPWQNFAMPTWKELSIPCISCPSSLTPRTEDSLSSTLKPWIHIWGHGGISRTWKIATN